MSKNILKFGKKSLQQKTKSLVSSSLNLPYKAILSDKTNLVNKPKDDVNENQCNEDSHDTIEQNYQSVDVLKQTPTSLYTSVLQKFEPS